MWTDCGTNCNFIGAAATELHILLMPHHGPDFSITISASTAVCVLSFTLFYGCYHSVFKLSAVLFAV